MRYTRREIGRFGALALGLGLGGGILQTPSLASNGGVRRDPMFDLAEFCAETRFDQLSGEVVAATKNQLLDTIGIALAAHSEAGVSQLRSWTLDSGGKPESRIWGTSFKVPAEAAARVNAAMSHALEFDDTYEPSFMHGAVVTVPAVVAVADLLGGLDGRSIIAAIAVGNDLCCRMSRAGSPGADGFVVGWDPTPLYGYISSAMVAGRLLGLGTQQIVSAAGLAFHQIAGNSQGNLDGAHSKRLGPGFASYGGISSAKLAQRGVLGAQRVLEGTKGLYQQYHGGRYSRSLLLDELGASFAGPAVAFKPYPSCRGGHVAIDAALELAGERRLKPDDIEFIEIHAGPGEFGLLNAPLERKQRPQSVVDAQFSNPWMVAAALQDGEVGLQHFTTEALQRKDILALTQRTATFEDKSLARPGGGPGAARVVLRLRGGDVVSKTVRLAKGDPRNPMSAAEFKKKFLDCTKRAGMDAAQAIRLHGLVMNLEKMEKPTSLSEAMRIV